MEPYNIYQLNIPNGIIQYPYTPAGLAKAELKRDTFYPGCAIVTVTIYPEPEEE